MLLLLSLLLLLLLLLLLCASVCAPSGQVLEKYLGLADPVQERRVQWVVTGETDTSAATEDTVKNVRAVFRSPGLT